MFKIFASIYSFLILFYLMSAKFYSHSERRILLGLLVLSAVVGLFIGPSISKKKSKEEKVQVEEDLWEIGDEYHNDFSKVGSAEDYSKQTKPVRPMDFGSDPMASARKELERDLLEIGLKDDEDLEDPAKKDT
jgi:hypothetical protein